MVEFRLPLLRYALLVCPSQLLISSRVGMDDQFFASVLKKWAHSSQEVVDLKRRLGQIEREVCASPSNYVRSFNSLASKRNEYGCDLKVGDGQVYAKGSNSPTTPENAALDLDEVGHKLEIARSEYQRRLREVCFFRLCNLFRN